MNIGLIPSLYRLPSTSKFAAAVTDGGWEEISGHQPSTPARPVARPKHPRSGRRVNPPKPGNDRQPIREDTGSLWQSCGRLGWTGLQHLPHNLNRRIVSRASCKSPDHGPKPQPEFNRSQYQLLVGSGQPWAETLLALSRRCRAFMTSLQKTESSRRPTAGRFS
jgi:hypothetical protein